MLDLTHARLPSLPRLTSPEWPELSRVLFRHVGEAAKTYFQDLRLNQADGIRWCSGNKKASRCHSRQMAAHL